MSTQDSHGNADWLHAWLETQREWLQRWNTASGEQRVDALREGMEAWRKQVTAPSPEFVGALQKFQELLQTGLAGAGEWTRTATGSEDSAALWQQLFNAYPLGPAREQQAAWQELARVAAEYQALAGQLAQAFAAVVKAALEEVPQEVERRAASATQGGHAGHNDQGGFRELYELWIDVAEREFAKLARDETFVRLQAELNNAHTRLRRAQQRIVEYALKQLDLPTRAELNSVHLRLRELTARVAELERAGENRRTRRGAKNPTS